MKRQLRTTLSRLKKLREHLLNNVPEERFCMGTWCRESECGTAACAWGHACSIPSFRRAGLQLLADPDIKYEETRCFFPTYQGYHGYEAAEQFLGISYMEACWLFDPLRYPVLQVLPNHVAERIDQLVRELETAASAAA
jgi:hypothetical protein